MLRRLSRTFLVFLTVPALALAACSSSSSTSDAGHDDRDGSIVPGPGNTDSGHPTGDAAGPANAYVSASLGTAATGACTPNVPASTPFFTLGSESQPAENGSAGSGSEVSVICQVEAAAGGTYIVNAQVSDGTLGSLSFSGTLSDSVAVQHGIEAGFTDGVSAYAEADCTFTLKSGATPADPSITSGRVWGALSCPNLTNPEQNAVCAGTAEIILENCAQ